ncbi:MAG: ABC transporter ATP-binding protein [Ruminococcaceae bacterium]|nr:ABC transporter ATP-binding protein [Oscillospiraceae bacterium]
MKKNSQLKWLLKRTGPKMYGKLALLTLLGVVMSTIGVRFAIVSKDLLDIASHSVEGDLTAQVIRLFVMLGLLLASQIFYSLYNARVSGQYGIRLKEHVFRTCLERDWQQVSNIHSGELINRIHSDVNVVVTGVMLLVPNLISLLVRIFLSFYEMFQLDWLLATICLILAPFILLTARLYSSRMKKLHKKCMETDGKTKSFMQEILQNLLVIKAYRAEDKVVEESRTFQFLHFKFTLKRNHISILMNILFYLALTASYYVAMGYCAWKLSLGLMTFGTLMAILQLVNQVQTPFKDLSSIVPQYFSTLASAERLQELENLSADGRKFLVDNKKPVVEVKNMSFSYGDEEIFDNTDFTMKDGEFIAISGISGIGKSTLLKLIMGILTPKSGEVCCYRELAYVPQGNMILSGTIRENIAFYRGVREDDIIKAAKTAEIYDFIQTLPEGFDTVLGEKGLGLSEGQVQRLAIARAVYLDAPLFLLDECTSALDEATEQKVLSNLKAMQGKSCIIISHKQAAFDIADRKIAVENRKIVSVG